MPETKTIKLTYALAFTVAALLVGAALGRLLVAAAAAPPPPNAPVVVRGGSVDGRAPIPNGSNNGWQTVTNSPPTLQTVATYNASSLYLDGVIPKGGSSASQYSVSGLTTNWKITLFFRDSGSTAKLLLCSNQNCDASGPLSASTNIYLESDGKGSFTPEGPLDGYDVQRYDLNNPSECASGNKCNHPGSVKVEGVSKWSDNSTVFDFTCRAGECDIYVGS